MKTITTQQAIEILSEHLIPDDFGCKNWDEVIEEARRHVDGIAVAMDLDNEYTIVEEGHFCPECGWEETEHAGAIFCNNKGCPLNDESQDI